MWGMLLLVCANRIHAMTCFSTSPFKQNPERCWGGAVCGDVLLLSLRSYTHIPQAAPSLCVLLHKHNSVHAGIHWLKHMQKAVLGTASLCFTHE